MPSTPSSKNKAFVAYVPAIHAGYVKFFSALPEAPIFVLGRSFIDAYPRLNRDIRALQPSEAVAALQALGRAADVLEIDEIEKLDGYAHLTLPDEDVSRDFAEKYCARKDTSLENVFLRWDGVFANKEAPVSPDRKTTADELHRAFMADALTEAQKSADWWRQIGALAVKDGAVVGKSHIRYFPSDLALDILGTPRTTVDAGERPDLYISMHAEADVIAQAAASGTSLQGANLYASTFPCINCAFLIARSGVRTVYYRDGYSRVDAEGVLKAAGVEIILVQ